MQHMDVEEAFEVERILNVRQGRRCTEYFVQWKGYSLDECSWEEDWRLESCHDAIEELLLRIADYQAKLEIKKEVKEEQREIIDLTTE